MRTARRGEGRAHRRFVAAATVGVAAWLLAPPLAAAAAAWLVPFWRAQQLVGTVHMASQVCPC